MTYVRPSPASSHGRRTPNDRERVERRSRNPPVQTLRRIDLLVAVGDGRIAHRLLLAEAENPEHLHRLQKETLDTVLQGVVEIDEDVPAEDDVEVIERRIRHEVVLRENDVLAQGGAEEGVV